MKNSFIHYNDEISFIFPLKMSSLPYFPVYKPMGCINRKSFSLQFFLHFVCIPCINRPPPSESETPCYLNSPESLPVNNV